MPETNSLPDSIASSPRKLLRSTAIAIVAALVLLVTVVMPAEYGVDPTGIGQVMGLTRMGQIKAQLAREAAADAAADNGAASVPGSAAAAAGPEAGLTAEATSAGGAAVASGAKTDTVQVALKPDEGYEIKLAMNKGARVSYSWSTDRGVVNYDIHADRTEPPAIKYHGYGKGQGKPSDEGELVAAFDGMHGWFWRNRTRETVTVTLRTSGDYAELKRMN